MRDPRRPRGAPGELGELGEPVVSALTKQRIGTISEQLATLRAELAVVAGEIWEENPTAQQVRQSIETRVLGALDDVLEALASLQLVAPVAADGGDIEPGSGAPSSTAVADWLVATKPFGEPNA